MTRHELEDLIDDIIVALRKNKELVGPVIDRIAPAIDAALADATSPFAEVVRAAWAVERDLVGRQGDGVVKFLTRLRKRPIILAAIAALA